MTKPSIENFINTHLENDLKETALKLADFQNPTNDDLTHIKKLIKYSKSTPPTIGISYHAD